MERLFRKNILRIDFLSPNVQLKIKGNNNIKTYFGGFYSILAIIILLIFTWIFGNDIIYKEKPILIELQLVTNYMPQINFNFYNNFLGFRVEYNNASIIKNMNRSFDFSATIQTYNYTSQGIIPTIQKIGIESCTFHKNTSFKNLFSDIDNLLCLNPKNDFIFGGVWGSNLTLIEIVVDYCKNTTENNNYCFSKEKINQIMNNMYFSFYYSDCVLDPTNFNKPFMKRISNIYTLIDGKMFKNPEFYYRSVDLTTDSGFFVAEISNITTLQYDKLNVGISSLSEDQSGLIQFDYYLNNNRHVTYRKYIKIQDVFAQLGGLIQVIIIFGNLALIFIRDLKMNSCIMNQLFDFPLIKVNKKKNNEVSDGFPISDNRIRFSQMSKIKKENQFNIDNEYKIKRIEQINEDRILQSQFSNDGLGNTRRNLMRIQNKLKKGFTIQTPSSSRKNNKDLFQSSKKDKKFKYNISEEFLVSFCCDRCTPEKNLIKYSLYRLIKDEVEKYLDLDYLIKKIHEIEYLKYLLLDREQISCFHFFQKAEICLDYQKARKYFSKIYSEIRNPGDDSLTTVINHFSTISYDEILDRKSLNSKLFDLLTEELQELIINKYLG